MPMSRYKNFIGILQMKSMRTIERISAKNYRDVVS